MKKTLLYTYLLLAFIILFSCSVEEEPILEEQFIEAPLEKSVYSTTIDKDQALQNLYAFMDGMDNDIMTLNSFGMQRKRVLNHIEVGRPLNAAAPAIMRTQGTDSVSDEPIEPYYHVFNFENDEGFAIMSGDTRLPEVFAITEKGYLDPTMPIENPGLADFIENLDYYYHEQINSFGGHIPWQPDIDTVNKNPIDPGVPVDPPQPAYKVVGRSSEQHIYYPEDRKGMCKVKWHQNSPFNYYTPQCYMSSIPVGNAKAGCSAIAMAMVMSAHKYPDYYIVEHANGRDTKDWLADKTNYHTRSFETDLGDGKILVRLDWDLINSAGSKLPLDSNGYNDLGADMRAALIRDIGSKLGLIWGINNTSLWFNELSNVNGTFPRFGYEHGVTKHDIRHDNVRKELRGGYPVMFYGVHGLLTGHTWVVHGYYSRIVTISFYHVYPDGREVLHSRGGSTHTYYLFAFGWQGGDADGYYLEGVYNLRGGPAIKDPEEGNGGSRDRNYDARNKVYFNIRPGK